MERTGEITAVRDNMLEITFCRPADCEKCHACLGGEQTHVVTVEGEGHVGDYAVISLPDQTIVRASLLAYICPVIGLFLGMLIAATIAPDNTLATALSGLIGLALPLVGLFMTEKQRAHSGRYAPQLVRVIPTTAEKD